MSRKIVFMDGDIPSIYFPIGKPEVGGTCFYATDVCIQNCPSGQLINEHERYALNYFQSNDAKTVIKKMIEDFEELIDGTNNAKMIQWYAWGDCPPDMTEQIIEVILGLRDAGIPQYGFTRNIALWDAIPKEDRLNIGLTIDDLDEAKLVSCTSGKMTACPDFEVGYARMIFDGEVTASCNGWWCVDDHETRNSDCSVCLRIGSGCYSR